MIQVVLAKKHGYQGARSRPRPGRSGIATFFIATFFFAYVLLALIAIHVAAALWHHLGKRDRVTPRMMDGAAN